RLVQGGQGVARVASGWRGAAPRADLDGIQAYRVARRYSFTLLARRAVRRRLRARRYDVLVEDLNKVPLYLPGMSPVPVSVLVHHLFGATVFQEAPWPLAALVWLSERPLPWAYRHVAFQAVSESTRADLVARGVAPEHIEVIPEGIDTAWFRPDPATRRAMRHARARVRQPGPAGVGAARRDRVPRAARRRAGAGRADGGARRRSSARSAAGPRRPRLRRATVLGAGGRSDGSASPPRHRAGRLTMRITITARHCEIPDELRMRARPLLERLTRLAPRSHDGQVLFVAD